jgi:hypothetical protein
MFGTIARFHRRHNLNPELPYLCIGFRLTASDCERVSNSIELKFAVERKLLFHNLPTEQSFLRPVGPRAATALIHWRKQT